MSELLPDEHIAEFASSGPKSHGYLQSGGKCCLKVKSIALNATNREKMNFEALRDLMLYCGINPDSDKPKKIMIELCSIIRNKQEWATETGPLGKMQKVVYDKRVLSKKIKSLPYVFYYEHVLESPLFCCTDRA